MSSKAAWENAMRSDQMIEDLMQRRRRAYRLQLLFQLACYTVGFFAGRWIVRQGETDGWDE